MVAPTRTVSPIGPGSEVGPFRVVRLVGRGGMGVVWLARDQRLGRRVALKLIDPDKLATRGARARFQREAAATAALAHPNVVTLFEAGDADGTPWVALEYIEGDTLRERLEDDPPPLRDALAIGRAVASALAAAHAASLLHRDLKPGNVILGRDGRPRVVDFGLARRYGDTTPDDPFGPDPMAPLAESDVAGTPRYMAPEQWRRDDPGPATDVWALGLILHELVWGHHPFDGLDRAGLREAVTSDAPLPAPRTTRAVPPVIADLITACLARAAADRPTASAVTAQLERQLERASVVDEADSPFRGLAPFTEKHAAAFFGRDGDIAAFLERIREQPIVPVVGPSGAGKSSFVHAGVVPRLRDRGWVILEVRPGRKPLAALARRLCTGDSPTVSSERSDTTAPTETTITGGRPRPPAPAVRDDEDELAADLAVHPDRLGLEMRRTADELRVRVALVVDQLEQLLAGGIDEDERRAFLRAIAAAADDPAEPVRVILTVRDDFLGRVAEVDEIRAALSRVTLLRSPGPEALREILVRPAEAAGYRWDDGLVDDMVAAVARAPAGLPLLAFTARQVWHRRDRERRRLTRATYDELGGVAGALAVHADGVLAGLTAAEEHVVRELLLRLVSPERTRRVVSRPDLLAGLPDVADELVQRLADARLLSTRRAAAGAGEVELAHDSLLSAWDRLARWIDESREDRAFLEHAAQSAALWRERGRRDDDLWQGEALADARRILSRGSDVPEAVAELLAASERLAARRRWRRRGVLALVVGALAAVAIVASLAAVRIAREERRARHRSAQAQVAAATAALAGDDTLAARAHVRGALEVEDSLAARALWQRLVVEPRRWRIDTRSSIRDLGLAPDGQRVAAVGQDGVVRLVDRDTGAVELFDRVDDQLFSVAWAPAGDWLAAGTWNGQIRTWTLPGRRVRSWPGHQGTVEGLAFLDGRLYSAGSDGALRVWDPATGEPLGAWSEGGAAFADLARDDGALYSASWDGAIRRWRDGTATVIGQHAGAATAVAVAGDRVVSGGRDGSLRMWTPAGEVGLGRVAGEVSRVAFEADGRRILVGTSLGPIHRLDLARGAEEAGLAGHTGGVRGLVVAGHVLVSGATDDSVRAWDLAVQPRRPEPGHSMTVVGVDVSADGTRAVSAGYDREARLWDLTSGVAVTTAVLRGHRGRVWAARLLPDGRAVTASADGTVRLWDGGATVAVAPLSLPAGQVYDVAVSPDGHLIAAAANDGRVHLWQPDSGAVRVIAVVDGGTVDGVGFSPDGQLVAAGASDHLVHLYRVETGAQVMALVGHESVMPGVGFSPDGKHLASCGEDGMVWLWDLATGEGRLLWRGARSYRVAWHPGGRMIGVASADGLARLFDVDGGPPRLLRGHLGEVNEVRFSSDGTLAVTVGNDGTVREWDVATGQPRRTPPPRSARAPIDPHPPPGLEAAPPSPVTAVADGPAGTLALGFASGEVGLWDRASGSRIDRLRLHGPVIGLTIAGGRLDATSELGDRVDLDLSALVRPYCQLMADVWADVPVTWDGWRAVRTPPPRHHRCR